MENKMGSLIEGFVERREKQIKDIIESHVKAKVKNYMETMFHWKFCETGYILLKDEGFSKWYECPVCKMKFESDASGMNCVNVIPTGRGRTAHWEPACPKCFEFEK
jgi:hypothetical protein